MKKEKEEVELAFKVIEREPRSKEAAEAREKILKIAKKWGDEGKIHTAFSLYKEYLQIEKQFPKPGEMPKASINRLWGIAPSWGRQAEFVRKRKVRPIDVGLTGIITWPGKLARTILESIKEQAEAEVDVKTKIEEELLELKMRLEMEEITEDEYKEKEAELKKKLDKLEK